MAIRWRDLLEHCRIPYTTHNMTRGWISVRCPWCGGTDPSQHLGIHEEGGYYNCLRSPNHGGRSPFYLLRALGVRDDLDALVSAYGGAPARRIETPPKAPSSGYAKRWDSFQPAADDPEACAYLTSRGFWNPPRTCRAFDLRVGAGRYGARLWFPLHNGSDVVGFTGRAMRGHQPRYLTEVSHACLYLPRPPYDTDKLVLLVEGPFDAIRLADALEGRYHVLTVALCGLSLSPEKRHQLLFITGRVPRLSIVLDSSVPLVNVHRLQREVSACISDRTGSTLTERQWNRVQRLQLPPGVDDPGDLTGEQLEIWLQATGVAQLAS